MAIEIGAKVRLTDKYRQALRKAIAQAPPDEAELHNHYLDRNGTVVEVVFFFRHLTTHVKVKWDGEPAPDDDGTFVYEVNQLEETQCNSANKDT